MHLSEALQHYGYYAILIGGFFEGETILILGAYAVHEGYLSMLPVISCGAIAAFGADQTYFFLARHRGVHLLQGRPKLSQRIERVGSFAARHPVATIFLMRFAWGFRIVMPAALGMGRLSAPAFMALDALAAVVWAAAVALFGIKITALAHAIAGPLHAWEQALIASAIVIALAVAFVRHRRSRR
jgi:membrane protein DedA with SNARE-associated domain